MEEKKAKPEVKGNLIAQCLENIIKELGKVDHSSKVSLPVLKEDICNRIKEGVKDQGISGASRAVCTRLCTKIKKLETKEEVLMALTDVYFKFFSDGAMADV